MSSLAREKKGIIHRIIKEYTGMCIIVYLYWVIIFLFTNWESNLSHLVLEIISVMFITV